MSQFAIPILDDVRNAISLPPPPMLDQLTGNLIRYANADSPRYVDLAVAKDKNIVYIDEEIDVYSHPGSHRHYRMMIRRLPWVADLRLILCAAHHMQLIGEYQFSYEQRTGLAADMERGYWDVSYCIPTERIKADSDTDTDVDITIPYNMRRRIWTELFFAMGHKVKFGSSVLLLHHKK